MAGRRPSDREFLSALAVPPEPGPGWDLTGGRFLPPPLAGRDLAWMLECCREDAEGECHVLRDGCAVLFERGRDLAFARHLAL